MAPTISVKGCKQIGFRNNMTSTPYPASSIQHPASSEYSTVQSGGLQLALNRAPFAFDRRWSCHADLSPYPLPQALRHPLDDFDIKKQLGPTVSSLSPPLLHPRSPPPPYTINISHHISPHHTPPPYTVPPPRAVATSLTLPAYTLLLKTPQQEQQSSSATAVTIISSMQKTSRRSAVHFFLFWCRSQKQQVLLECG